MLIVSYIKYLSLFPKKWYGIYKLRTKYPTWGFIYYKPISYNAFKNRQVWIDAAKEAKRRSTKKQIESVNRGYETLKRAGYDLSYTSFLSTGRKKLFKKY
jgi:hypothetical protein